MPIYFASVRSALFLLLLCSQVLLSTGLPTPLWTRDNDNVRLIQYVQTFRRRADPSQYLSLLPMIRREAVVTHVILAALHINAAPGDITLNDLRPTSTTYDTLWPEVEQLQQSGVKVMVMMGGAARGSYAGRLCRTGDGSIDSSFYDPLVEFLERYHLDGIDLDIEEPVPVSCAQGLVESLKKDMGSAFIITLAPVASDLTPTMRGLSGFGYRQLEESSAGPMIDWYNTQYYSGFVEGSIEQSYAAAVGNRFPASRVVMGVLDSPEDGSGFLDLNSLRRAIASIRASFPDMSGVDGWEYFNAGFSDGFQMPARWLKEIGKAIFAGAVAGPAAPTTHAPPLSNDILQLMRQGYSQVDAAIVVRRAHGHDF